ncbi:MAG: nucleotidyltransferase domain-containing protein [Candidatus Aminicenantes bacterium]|nr:nucleotidyltransferase domain-containing protein [Candidatus Aminicenantes bacterium]
MLKEKFAELLNLLLVETKAFYREDLISFVVYGSVARETYRFDSDVDILIIAKNLPRGRMKRVAQFMQIEEKIEPYLKELGKNQIQTFISPLLKTPEEAERGSPLFLDMVEDAKILYDKNNFFTNILSQLRKRLKALGARRVWQGNAWYWILKPDYKPGEIFEL